ncbi:MAG: hypothetical protein PHW82_11870 [Bacteroidales bacterium]|nr:hypothetical protein [Bacteroidales bacterium]MDY0324155.1 hypothetical protein [Candidatus Carbobacillus sp.]
MPKQKKYYFLFFVITFIVIYLGIIGITKNAPYRACENKKTIVNDKEYKGLVINKYLDEKNHMNETVIIKDSNAEILVLLNGDTSGLYDSINLNDSIYKKKESMEVLLVRDTHRAIYVINFDCDKIKKQ